MCSFMDYFLCSALGEVRDQRQPVRADLPGAVGIQDVILEEQPGQVDAQGLIPVVETTGSKMSSLRVWKTPEVPLP